MVLMERVVHFSLYLITHNAQGNQLPNSTRRFTVQMQGTYDLDAEGRCVLHTPWRGIESGLL